jgi:hypothetical protein
MVQNTLQNEKLIDCSKEHPRKEKTDVGKKGWESVLLLAPS